MSSPVDYRLIDSGFYTFIWNEPRNPINMTKLNRILETLVPLTLPFVDSESRRIQLWKTEKYGMVASILDSEGKMSILPKNKIHSLIGSRLSGDSLMKRLEEVSLR